MPILDPNIYVPNPANASDAYPPYDRGAELEAYIRNGTTLSGGGHGRHVLTYCRQ